MSEVGPVRIAPGATMRSLSLPQGARAEVPVFARPQIVLQKEQTRRPVQEVRFNGGLEGKSIEGQRLDKSQFGRPQIDVEKPPRLDAYVSQEEINKGKLIDQVRVKIQTDLPIAETTDLATASDLFIYEDLRPTAGLTGADLWRRKQENRAIMSKKAREAKAANTSFSDEKTTLGIDWKTQVKRLRLLCKATQKAFGKDTKVPLSKVAQALDLPDREGEEHSENAWRSQVNSNTLVSRDEALRAGEAAIAANPAKTIQSERGKDKTDKDRRKPNRNKQLQRRMASPRR